MSETLEKIPRLLRLDIKHSRYQPDFKPINGKLIAHYNGAILAVTVSGVEIVCETTTLEGRFTVECEQSEPAFHTWAEIWHHMLIRVIIALQSGAAEQKEYMKKGGVNVRN